ATYKPVGTNTCAVKHGEQLGIQKFSRSPTDERLIIKPETLATLEASEDTEVYVGFDQGVLTTETDVPGFCSSSDVTVIGQSAGGPGPQAVDITYSWSNIRISSTPQAPGTQMIANLEYTEAGCTAQYEVWGMWPAVPCGTEEDGTAGEPDNSICANAGSINPDFATTCDPDALLCVPARRPPSLK
ncbi:MAG TPA: hypothetical protein VF815_07390, partial [Myxococcaceae bacterium]